MHRLYIPAAFLILTSAYCPAATPTNCTPPADLQAKLQAKPLADTYAAVGLWYGDHGKYACAIEAYQSALKQNPTSPDLLYSLGLNLIRHGDFQDAIRPLQQSIAIKPEVFKPHLLLATAFEELHHPADARAEWTAALKIDPHSYLALDGESKNLLATRDFDAVVALLTPEPKIDVLTADLASAYESMGNIDQAIEVVKRGLETNPKSAPLARALIMDLALKTRYKEASDLSQKLVTQHPRDLEAKILYLHVLVLSGAEEKARPLASALLSAAPHNFSVLYLNGLLENQAGNYAKGRRFLEQAVAVDPNQSNGHYHLALALAKLNDPPGAKEHFEKALALGATEPRVRFEYAKALRNLGETQSASEQLKLYEEAERADSARNQAAVSMALGDKEMAAGNPGKAAEFYREAIANLPQSARLEYKLSTALDQIGDVAGEREALQKAVQIDPGMAIAHRQLGYLAFNDADFATAEEQFRKAVEAAPAFADAWVSLAATLATESRAPEAAEAVRHALAIDPQNANALALQKELANAASSNR